MPKVSVLQTSFTAGEFSPLLQGRVDSERYKSGMAVCLNYLPTIQGPLIRRPGTKFVNNVKDSTKQPVLIPFQYSASQAYVFEFGDKYVRFYANSGQVIANTTVFTVHGTDAVTGVFPFTATRQNLQPSPNEVINSTGSIGVNQTLELPSPYAYTDVAQIKWAQISNAMYLTHPSYPPYKLVRVGAEYWDLKQVQFKDGPYLPLNSYASIGDQTAVQLIQVNSSTFYTAPILTISAIVAGGDGTCYVTFTTSHNLQTGNQVVISDVVGTTEANNTTASLATMYWPVRVVASNTVSLVGSVFVNNYISGGFSQPALFQPGIIVSGWEDIGRSVRLYQTTGSSVWGYITGVSSMNVCQITVGPNVTPTQVLIGSAAISIWQMGVWKNGDQNPTIVPNNYPAAVCFHQNRLVFAGAPLNPQEVDFSNTGDYENFSPNNVGNLQVTANNALQFTLNSSDNNTIQWMKSTVQGLVAGTQSAEWQMTPSANSEALSPTNFNASQTSYFGSAAVDAVQAGNAVLYVNRAQRKVREMSYFFQVGTFRSTDLTELSDVITLPMITKLVVQKETQPIVWGIRSDGVLLSMIYNRDDLTLKVGWSRNILGGQSDAGGTQPLVKSLAVIPAQDTTFDQLWMINQRYINNSSILTVEYMTKPFDDATLQEDAYHWDCGGTYDSPVTITGISTSSSAVVTAAGHGFNNGSSVRIVSVIGMNSLTVDVNGNVTTNNLVNEQTFLVGSSATNTFNLLNFSGQPISSVSSSAYVSGGQVRKLVSSVSGLSWLVGQTVGVLADGSIHPPVMVNSSGVIALQYQAAKVQIGYAYNSDGKLLRPEAGAADGTSIGKTRRISRVAILLHNVGDFQMGTSFTNLIPVEFQVADVQMADQATPLYSGMHRNGVESAYDFEGQFCFRQNSGLPGMIQSTTLFMEEFDV